MKQITIIILLISIFGCNSKDNLRLRSTALDKISLSGNHYDGTELEEKLKAIVNYSDFDSIFRNTLFKRIEYVAKNYKAAQDEYGSTQVPSCFLFLDINNDGLEDMIFQSNGSFFFDSHLFTFFISGENGNYYAIQNSGQIIDVNIIEEYCCSVGTQKNKYLEVEYFSPGCCDNPWDKFITGIADIDNREKDLKTIKLESINRTSEYVSSKAK